MLDQLNGRPGDQRGFVHKKLLGGISRIAGLLPIPAPISTIVGGLAGRFARTATARVTPTTIAQREQAQRFKLGIIDDILPPRIPIIGGDGRGPCGPGLVWSSQLGTCVAIGSPVQATFAGGVAVAGQYGAGLAPGSQIVDRATCLRGMVLGNDSVCYNKGQIKNNQRMWPAGRKPLLTGGDMRAISTAARAGRRMDVATKRLQKMGMMKKPARRGVPAGHRAKLVHASDH